MLSEGEIIKWLSRAAIFCLPVKYEPFGLAILEAALSGCALVVGDIPSQREIWGKAAIFVNPNDAGDISAALNQLTQDEFFRNIMGFRALNQALRYSIKQTAADYWQVYGQLLGRSTTRELTDKILT